nr:transposase [Nostoc flagelliforme]
MERCKILVKNFERTLANATAKVNLCLIRLMVKRLAAPSKISNGFYNQIDYKLTVSNRNYKYFVSYNSTPERHATRFYNRLPS